MQSTLHRGSDVRRLGGVESLEHLRTGHMLLHERGHRWGNIPPPLRFDQIVSRSFCLLADTVMAGPLCSADACEAADAERARLMEAKNAADAAAKKLKQQQEKPKTRQELLAIDQNAEAEWKKKEAREAKKKLRKKRKAQKAKTLSELAQEQVGGDVLV